VNAPVPHLRLAALYFVYFGYVGAYSPYLSLYLQSIGHSAQAIGVLLALSQGTRIFGPPLWASLADRSGKRLALLRFTAMAGAASFAGMLATTSFGGIALVLVVHGLVTSGVNPLIETITLGALREAVARYGAIRMWGSVGFVVAVMGVGWMLDHFRIETMLWASLALFAAAAVFAWTLDEAPAGARPRGGEVRAVLRRPEVRALFAACFLMSAAHQPLYAFYTIWLVDHGYSKSLVGWLWSVGVFAEIIVFWLMPRWMTPARIAPVLAASFGCAVVRFVVVGWMPGSLAAQILAQVLHAATFGAYHVTAVALVNRWFGEAGRARGQALYASLSYGAGGMAGAVASGWLWDRIGGGWTFTIASAIALAGLLPLVREWKMLIHRRHDAPPSG